MRTAHAVRRSWTHGGGRTRTVEARSATAILGFDTETYRGYVKCLGFSDSAGTVRGVLESAEADTLLEFVHGKISDSGERYGVLWNLGFDTAALVKRYVVDHAADLRKQHYRKIEVRKTAARLIALQVTDGLSRSQRSELKDALVELDGMETVERFDTDRFHVELVGSKGLGITPLKKRKKGGRWLFDASGFYVEAGHGGMRLETAASRYLGQHKSDAELGIDRARIGAEAGYYEAHRDAIVDYCCQDARLTAALMERTIAAFANLRSEAFPNGFAFPEKPFSKGSVSKAILKEMGTLDATQREYERVKLSAYARYWEGSFAGGVFLLRAAGRWRDCYAIDLNSAYPWAMADFPSLEGCVVVDGSDPRFKDAQFKFHKVRVIPSPRTPLKERGSTRKVYAYGTEPPTVLYLTDPDLESLRLWGDVHQVIDSVGIVCPSKDRPFGWLKDAFRLKAQIKIEFGGESVEYLNIKIVCNGTYGVTAQRRPRESKFTNMVYAAYTTALCRRELWKAAKETEALGDRILQYATDGLLIANESGGRGRDHWVARRSKELGAWDVDAQVDATLFESGVYVIHGPDPKLKRRGFPDLTVDALQRCRANYWLSQREAPVRLRQGLIWRTLGKLPNGQPRPISADDIGVFYGVDRTLAPVQAAADAGFVFPKSMERAPLSAFFEKSWLMELKGERSYGPSAAKGPKTPPADRGPASEVSI